MQYKAPRGTQDILPGESERWQWLERTFREVCALYGYQEIRTPAFESTDLFHRGLGEQTEVVTKQMYTFLDQGGRSLTLKPEGTAPAIRAYLEHSLGGQGRVTRLYYITPIFRYERPQAGRYRQAHQTGVELIGSAAPEADAEVIDLTFRWYRTLGIERLSLKLNSLGMAECRARYREALLQYAQPILADMKDDERARYERNPLRLLDTKDPDLQERLLDAPIIEPFLEEDSREHFHRLRALLDALNIPYEVDPRLVRGLDYYTRTVFEVQSDALGAQNSLCGGGRYDNLIEEMGGTPTPATGVAMGMERALLAASAAGSLPPAECTADVFVVILTPGEAGERLLSDLRSAGIRALSDPDRRSAKSQFRQADKSGAPFAVTLGEDEIARKTVRAKRMETGEETEVRLDELPAWLLKRLGKG